MVNVIFEVEVKDGQKARYQELAKMLTPSLEQVPGFIARRLYVAPDNPNKMVSMHFWESEEAVNTWRNNEAHRMSQKEGHESIIESFQITVSEVSRTYTLKDREQAPKDSNEFHNC